MVARVTVLSALELEPQCTLLQWWNTRLLKFWSWQVMLLVTTRRPGSSPVTFSWLSAMTRSWTSFCQVSPLPREVYCPISRLYSCPRRPRKPSKQAFCWTSQTKRPFLGPLHPTKRVWMISIVICVLYSINKNNMHKTPPQWQIPMYYCMKKKKISAPLFHVCNST